MVKIDIGQLSLTDSYYSRPQSEWMELFILKSACMRNRIDVSAKTVLRAVEEAGDVYDALGFESAEQMITEGYDLDLREIEHARKWLEISGVRDVRYTDAVANAEELGAAAKQGRPPKDVEKGSNTTFSDRGATYTCRRLLRDRPDLFERVKAGELSPNAAAIEAGFRKKQISVPVGDAEACVRRLKKHYTLEEIVDGWNAKQRQSN